MAKHLWLVFVFSVSACAQTFTVLDNFTSDHGAGHPIAGLLRDASGNLYGSAGGGTYGYGTIFELSPAGEETVLYSFRGLLDGDGWEPTGLLRDKAGNFYGTTIMGGQGYCTCCGCGVVFKVDPTGTETVLYAFTGGTDGGRPMAGLVRDTAGNLYGTTRLGGDLSCDQLGEGCGTVFKVDTLGRETVLHSFGAGVDGKYPEGRLVQDSHGNFYGTTEAGGTSISGDGGGTVFKLSSTGEETVLFNFIGSPTGAFPASALLREADGTLYGTTLLGGAYSQGTVFKLTPDGKETVLHSFNGLRGGGSLVSALIQDKEGNFYGTTYLGGDTFGICNDSGCGTVFKLTSRGGESVLYRFNEQGGYLGGWWPQAPLIRDDAGNLYGTASSGGIGAGTVFKITP
jgi:uncharacterized repeat protein (TIGR03803 family)